MGAGACTFFGHRDSPGSLRGALREAIRTLIVQQGVACFYVGDHGAFDSMVYAVLKELQQEFPHICIAVVLAYLPRKAEKDKETMLPEGIEAVLPRYAILWRNRWMIRRSSFVITYVTRGWGGAADAARRAERQGKTLIRLGSL